MSLFPLLLTRRFPLIGLALLLLALAPRPCAAKVDAPITASLQILTSPTLGGSCTVIWAGVPEITPLSAELGIRMTAPDGTVTTASQAVTLTRGRVTDATWTFKTPSAGTYGVLARITMNARNGRYVGLTDLKVTVPALGRAFLARERVLTAREYAAKTYIKTPKIVDKRPAKTAFSPGFTVSGTFQYTNKLFDQNGFTGTALAPIRRASVVISETDGGNSTTTLGVVLTSDTGAFSFNVPAANVASFGRDLLIQLWAESAVGQVHDLASVPYSYTIPVAQWQGGPLSLGTLSLDVDQSGPWNIYDCLIQGSEYTRTLIGVDPYQCRVAWAEGNTNGTYFSNINNTIWLVGTGYDPDEFDDAVILHEYGHFVCANYAYDKSTGGMHAWTSHISQALAWSEGWANFFSSAVRNNSHYVDTTIWGTMDLDLELPTDNVTNDDNEGAVAASLWDIFDTHNDGRDQLSDGISNIWLVVSRSFTPFRRCVFRDFYDGWVTQGRTHLPEVQNILLEHGISYPLVIVTSLKINNGIPIAASPTVTLNNTCIGSPVAYMASENQDFTGANWKVYSAAPAFTFPAGSVVRGLYFKVKDAAGNESAPAVATISLGAIPITPLIAGGPKLSGSVGNEFDYNLYTFTVTTPGIYVIDTAAGLLDDSVMSLYGPDSQTALIEENDDGHGSLDYMSRITATLQPGTYYVKVKGFATLTGDYTVWLTAGAPAPPILLLTSNGPVLPGNIDPAAGLGENWFKLSIEIPGVYTIETREGTLSDTRMEIYGPGNRTTLIASDDDGGKNYMSLISRNFDRGAYYVRITPNLSILSGDYKILAYPGTRGVPAPLTINAPAVSNNITSSTDFNWFTFTVTIAGSYVIETSAGTISGDQLFLYGPNDRNSFRSMKIGPTPAEMAVLEIDLNPGIYYLKIEGYQNTDIGSYSLRVRTNEHPVSLPATGSWIRSTISGSAQFNWFQFTVTAPMGYSIQTAAGTLKDTVMHLYGPNDSLKQIAQADDNSPKDKMSMITTYLAPGTYYVMVEGYSIADVGDYRIRLVPIPAVPSTPLAINDAPTMAAISLPWDVDWYSFTVNHAANYVIESLPGTIKGNYFRVYGPGNQVNLVGQNGRADATGRVMLHLAPGTYYIKLEPYSKSDLGSYTIQVREEVATLTVDGVTTRGTISAGWDCRWYSFQIPSTGRYTIETSAGTMTDNFMRLYGPNSRDALLDMDSDSGPGAMAAITRLMTPGTYYVKITGLRFTDLGTFWVGVHRTVTPLSVNGPSVSGQIEMAADADWYSFSVTRTDDYTIETTAGTLSDDTMSLYGPNGFTTLLAQDDNGGKGKMAKIKRKLTRGTYYVMVSGRTSINLGTYQIKVSR